MRVGLLICDHVRPEFLAAFGDYDQMFTDLFPDLDWQFYEVTQGQFPTDLAECEVYFTTGSHHSVYENLPWIGQLKSFIRDLHRANGYFVGVCFGHQILAEALGGKVEQSSVGWCVGVHAFEVLREEPWMQPVRRGFNLLMSCQDQVVRLPEGAVLLASSEKCPVGMFRVGERMLGMQAHPEFSKGYAEALMEQRVGRIGEAVVRAGKKSLELSVDAELIRAWVKQFLK